MKRVLIFVLSAAIALSCGAAFAQEAKQVLVVFYSRDGHTRQVAQEMAKRFDADLEELIDQKDRIGPVASTAAGKDALAKKLTKLKPLTHDPQAYAVILIGTPSWFGNVTPAVRTFLKQNPLKGKKVGVFGTAHLTGIEACLKDLARLVAPEVAASVPQLPLRHKDLAEGLAGKIDLFYRQVMGEAADG